MRQREEDQIYYNTPIRFAR